MRTYPDYRLPAIILLASFLHAGGASEAGVVRGVVVDPGGYPLPGASILVSATGSDRHYESNTGRDGQFRITGVIPGRYTVSIRLGGFREKKTDQIEVEGDSDIDIGKSVLTFLPCNTAGGPICDDFGLGIYNSPIHAQGNVVLSAECSLDVDEGASSCPGDSASNESVYDLRLGVGASGEIYIIPRNTAQLALNPATTYDLQGCVNAKYSKDRVRIDGLPLGSRICVKSNAERYSQIMSDSIIKPGDGRVRLRFVTWAGRPDHLNQLTNHR
jgi:hypothetical protein